MIGIEKAQQKRASAVLKSVEGLSIAEAQGLLKWCNECLLEQTVSFRDFVPCDADSENAGTTQKSCCLCSPTASL